MLYALPLLVFGLVALLSSGKRRFLGLSLVFTTIVMHAGLVSEVVL